MLPLFIIRNKLLAEPAKLGRWGERYCERYLRRMGLECIARNFSINTGEIDLVMADGDVLVFVEVKTRASENFAKAQEAVNHTKRMRMISATKYFIGKYKLRDKPVRFDVVAVVLPERGSPEIRHYKNAFGMV